MRAHAAWKREPITRAKVYRNLHNGLLSVMGMDGLVHGHFAAIIMRDIRFRVSLRIVTQIRREKRKTVGMFAVGELVQVSARAKALPRDTARWKRIRVNPYLWDGFVDDDDTQVSSADKLVILANGDMRALSPAA